MAGQAIEVQCSQFVDNLLTAPRSWSVSATLVAIDVLHEHCRNLRRYAQKYRGVDVVRNRVAKQIVRTPDVVREQQEASGFPFVARNECRRTAGHAQLVECADPFPPVD